MRHRGFTARMQSPIWDSQQHVTMEEVAVLTFLSTCESCLLSGGRTPIICLNQMTIFFVCD